MEQRAYWVVNKCNMNLAQAGEERLLELQKLEELCLEAYENSGMYKEKSKLIHDKGLLRKKFRVGQKVSLFNPRLSLMTGILKCKCLGPFEIVNLFPCGAMEIRNPEMGKEFKVNGHHPKILNNGEVNVVYSKLMLTPSSVSPYH
ncbi:uncharacterized protein LOC120084101 [Benincasa hispida]|uniref:uncharacterized protein LOC120084101 n=1 Tax=Benincasa hispida TaxID=102211 RepID=UPI0019006446|nr:uncharacterized protein LOC120084101 [Benincasa hispida]